MPIARGLASAKVAIACLIKSGMMSLETCGYRVRQQYPLVCATVEDISAVGLETAKCVAELVAESTSHAVALLTSFATG